MKKILTLFTFILFSTALNSYASDIAVVDTQRVLKEAKAAQDIREQIKAQLDKYQSDVKKEEENLRKTEQKLNQEKAILSADALKDKREQYKEDVTKFQRDVQEKRAQLDAAYNESMETVQKSLFEVITSIAKEKGFKIAVPTAQILYSEESMNITDEVLKQMNEKLPTVKVTVKPLAKANVKPAAEKAAPAKAEKKKEEPKKAE